MAIGFPVAVESPQIIAGDLKVYPNPSKGPVTVDLPEGVGTNSILSVMSIDGRQIKQEKINSADQKISLDLSGLSSGTYEISILTPTHRYAQKMVIQ